MSSANAAAPRALFIAAFAVAGALLVRVRAPSIPHMTPAREARRDRSIAHIARHLGRSIVAAEQASVAFFKRGTAYEAPTRTQRTDVALVAIMQDAEVAAQIGAPGLRDTIDAPWVEVDREAAAPCVRLYWRGELMPGERMPRVIAETATGVVVRRGTGQVTDSTRDLDPERFARAVEAAKSAMRKHGVRLSSFTDVRRLRSPSIGGGAAFEGIVATIGLARVQNPVTVARPVR